MGGGRGGGGGGGVTGTGEGVAAGGSEGEGAAGAVLPEDGALGLPVLELEFSFTVRLLNSERFTLLEVSLAMIVKRY